MSDDGQIRLYVNCITPQQAEKIKQYIAGHFQQPDNALDKSELIVILRMIHTPDDKRWVVYFDTGWIGNCGNVRKWLQTAAGDFANQYNVGVNMTIRAGDSADRTEYYGPLKHIKAYYDSICMIDNTLHGCSENHDQALEETDTAAEIEHATRIVDEVRLKVYELIKDVW